MLLSVISIIPSYKDSTSYIYFIYTLMAHLVIFDFIFRFLLKKEYFSFQKSLFLFMLVPICLLPFGLIFHQPLNFLIFKNIYLDMYHFLYLYLFLVIHSFNFVFALYNLKFGYLERRIFISLFSLTCLYSTILVYPNLYFSLILSSLLSVILNVIFWSRNESRRYS